MINVRPAGSLWFCELSFAPDLGALLFVVLVLLLKTMFTVHTCNGGACVFKILILPYLCQLALVLQRFHACCHHFIATLYFSNKCASCSWPNWKRVPIMPTNLTLSLSFFLHVWFFLIESGWFISTVVFYCNNAWDNIQTISLSTELHVDLSPQFSHRPCFPNNNNVSFDITGPKTVKLFSNKEHMGFRYATPWLEQFELSKIHYLFYLV